MEKDFFSKIDFQALLHDSKKSSRRKLQLARASISLIYQKGLENFSLELLAKKCKVTRSLIYHYFPTLTDLLIFTSAYIRYRFQVFVLSKMAEKSDLREILEAYISSSLLWIDEMPKEACIWIIFFHKCSVDQELAEHNQKLVSIGTSRIEALLLAGIEKGIFHCPQERTLEIARTIQILVTGGLISRATEQRSSEYWAAERNSILKTCLMLVS